MEIEGIVERVSNKDGRFGICLVGDLVNGKPRWFNGFGEVEIEKGDKAKITYEENTSGDRTYYNTKSKNVVKTGESMSKQANKKSGREFMPASEYKKMQEQKDRMITRSVAFKGAVQIMEAMMTNKGVAFTKEGTIDAVKEYTNEFEKIILNMQGKSDE